MLQDSVPNPLAEAPPRITLQDPVVMQHPADMPKAVLFVPVVTHPKEA
jgi:hypothetical protein